MNPAAVKGQLSRDLLDRLACPRCRGRALDATLACAGCGTTFPVRDGVADLRPQSPPLAEPSALDLSVLILAYNEADNVERVMPPLRHVLDDLGCAYEILVVDGGSRDATVARAKEAGARVHVQRGPGYGNAFREGIAECRGRFVLTLDADLSHDPAFIRILWERGDEADLVVGSRYVEGGEADLSLFRRYLSRFMNGVYRRVLQVPVRDLSSGFRLYRRAATEHFPRLLGRDFDVLVEALITMHVDGWRVLETPMHFKPRGAGASNLRVARFGVSYFRNLVRLARLRHSGRAADAADREQHSARPWVRRAARERVRAVRELLGEQSTDVLILACGSHKLLQALPGAVGVDARWPRLRHARRRSANVVAAHDSALPFRGASFGAAVWTPDAPPAVEALPVLRELRRVVRPGGTLVASLPRHPSLADWVRSLTEHAFEPLASRTTGGGSVVLARRMEDTE